MVLLEGSPDRLVGLVLEPVQADGIRNVLDRCCAELELNNRIIARAHTKRVVLVSTFPPFCWHGAEQRQGKNSETICWCFPDTLIGGHAFRSLNCRYKSLTRTSNPIPSASYSFIGTILLVMDDEDGHFEIAASFTDQPPPSLPCDRHNQRQCNGQIPPEFFDKWIMHNNKTGMTYHLCKPCYLYYGSKQTTVRRASSKPFCPLRKALELLDLLSFLSQVSALLCQTIQHQGPLNFLKMVS